MSSVADVGRSITTRRESKHSSETKLEAEIQKQAEKLCRKWAAILGLHKWTISIFTVPGGTLATANGPACMASETHPGTRSAKIGIDYEYPWNDEDGYNGFEVSFVHEMLHILEHEQGVEILETVFDKRAQGAWHSWNENTIDRLSKVLVALANKG